MLEINNLVAGYGKKQVLFGLNLTVEAGELVALIGPNGAGKSTVLKVICGLLPIRQGDVRFVGESLNGATPSHNLQRGVVYAPQGNRVFDELTVMENLELGGMHLAAGAFKNRLDMVLEMFSALRPRIGQEAGNLSGGEQQMLSLARALIPQPKMLLLDEPSLGLAPGLVAAVFARIEQINRQMGVTVLLVEQKVREALEICHRVYSLKLGKVVFSGLPEELQNDRGKLKSLFL